MIDKLKKADGRRVGFAKGVRTRWDALPRGVRLLGVLAVLVFAIYLPFLELLPFAYIRTDLTSGGSDWSSVLFIMSVYMIVAVGLNVVIGLAGLLDLGYIGFFAIGAYSVALFGSPSSPVTNWISERFGLSEDWAVGFAACVPIAVALTMISGVILGAPTLRLRGDYLAIVTMGFGEIIRIVMRNATSLTGGPNGVSSIPKPPGPETAEGRPFFNVLEIYKYYWLALAVLVFLIWAVRRLEDSRVGRSWLAIREDEDAAGIMGVPAFKFKLWAFAIGAALGGVAGLLFASRQAFIEPNNFQLNLSFLFVAMVVIGGSGNILGVCVGAALLTYLPERFREFEELRPFAFGVAMVAVMVLRPQGLIPNRRRASELEDRRHEAEEMSTNV